MSSPGRSDRSFLIGLDPSSRGDKHFETMASAIEEFISKPPRERSGPLSANRFDYQLCWAFCLLLDLESQQKDYLLFLDYHDDVVVFDSESLAAKADFFQVKTDTKSHWSITKLLSKKSGKLSILGKLYSHKILFGNVVRSLNFITNANFSLELGKTGVSAEHGCSLGELCDRVLARVRTALQKEHKLEAPPACEDLITLRTDSLSALDHFNHTAGRFSEHIAKHFEGSDSPMLSNSLRVVLEELRRRNNHEGEIGTLAQLAKKSIGKTEFSSLLSKCAYAGSNRKWDTLERVLAAEGVDYFELRRFQRAWETRKTVRLDVSDAIVARTQKVAEEVVQRLKSEMPSKPLHPFIIRAVERCRALVLGLEVPISENDLLGAVITVVTDLE